MTQERITPEQYRVLTGTADTPARKRKKVKRTEDDIQRRGVKALRLAYPDAIVIHVPNGGGRTRVEGAILKGLGVLAGFPDLLIMWGFGGVGVVEVKRPDGKLSESQRAVRSKLRALGHKYAVARSPVEIVEAVAAWIADDQQEVAE